MKRLQSLISASGQWSSPGVAVRTAMLAATLAAATFLSPLKTSAQDGAATPADQPNILVMFGDDIGQTNISAYSMGILAIRPPILIAWRRKA